jgi:hypothetical protein
MRLSIGMRVHLALLVLVCGCGSNQVGNRGSASTSDVANHTVAHTTTIPALSGGESGGVEGEIIFSRIVPQGEPRDDALIDGSFTLLKGCYMVNSRFPILWPHGTVQTSEGVRLSSGADLAPGETFSLPGSYLRFASVEMYLTDASAVQLLKECDTNKTDQFAVIFP